MVQGFSPLCEWCFDYSYIDCINLQTNYIPFVYKQMCWGWGSNVNCTNWSFQTFLNRDVGPFEPMTVYAITGLDGQLLQFHLSPQGGQTDTTQSVPKDLTVYSLKLLHKFYIILFTYNQGDSAITEFNQYSHAAHREGMDSDRGLTLENLSVHPLLSDADSNYLRNSALAHAASRSYLKADKHNTHAL